MVNFMHLHVRDTVVILDKGNLPHPRCPQCDVMVTWNALNRRHLSTTQCANGGGRKCRQLAEEELWKSLKRSFQAYVEPLETVMCFNYMGRVLTAGGDDWTELASNLRKARNSWMRMTRILIREGADPKVLGLLF